MATLSGGRKFEAAMAELAKGIGSGKTAVKVGFLEGAKYPDGKSVAMIAAINEYGAPSRGQPPRPFFRNMIALHSAEWPTAIAGLLRSNDLDAGRALDAAGHGIAGQLKQSIVDLTRPPLAASTIRRKGFDKPLIQTGHMLNSVDHEVVTPP